MLTRPAEVSQDTGHVGGSETLKRLAQQELIAPPSGPTEQRELAAAGPNGRRLAGHTKNQPKIRPTIVLMNTVRKTNVAVFWKPITL